MKYEATDKVVDLVAVANNVSEQYLEALLHLVSTHRDEINSLEAELNSLQLTQPPKSKALNLSAQPDVLLTTSSPPPSPRALPDRMPRETNGSFQHEDQTYPLETNTQSPSRRETQGSSQTGMTHSASERYTNEQINNALNEPSTFDALKVPKHGASMEFVELVEDQQTALRTLITPHVKSQLSKTQSALNLVSGGNFFQSLLTFMDTTVAVTIVLNAIVIGLETDHLARRLSYDSPPVFDLFEIFFCAVFTGEMTIRMLQHRTDFFTKRGRYWNAFDLMLVILQWIDVLGLLVNPMKLTFLRLFRILRLLRVLRVIRLLQFFGQANIVVDAIYNSMVNLAATVGILLVIIYCAAVVITQAVTSYRLSDREQGITGHDDLLQWWGNLWRSMLTLLESVLDGNDWDTALSTLAGVSILLEMLFLMFVVFVMLAMLNVITGIFVQAALRNADRSKDSFFMSHCRQLFHMLDPSYNGEITRSQYMDSMDSGELQKHMYEMDIDPREAKLLFNYIDSDNSNTISAEELLTGLLRLRSGAKFMDLMSLMHEIELQNMRSSVWFQKLEQHMAQTVDLLQSQKNTCAATAL